MTKNDFESKLSLVRNITRDLIHDDGVNYHSALYFGVNIPFNALYDCLRLLYPAKDVFIQFISLL